MPNWKKLITSGSSGSLAHLSVDTSVEATSFTGSLLSTNGVISGSAQIDGFVSQSGNFVANETIIATGTNSVTSSNILALDTVNNYLGINQSNPEVTLHMTGDGAQTAQIRMEQYNDSSDAPDIRTRKARGTSASPAKNNAGDFIYRQNSERYNGSAYTTVGQFAVDSTGSADRFRLTLTVSEDGNTIDAAANQFMIDGNNGGAIKFNNSYYFPTSDGNANEVLTTDGSGTLTFSNPIPSGTISSSAQIASDISGSITTTSSSIASDIATLVSFSSSLETTIYDYTGSFTGDGSGLTNVTTTVSELTTKEDTFTSATTHSVVHTFGTKNLNITVFDENDDIFIPVRINTPNTSSVVLYMEPASTGRVVISKGGHIVTGSIQIVSSSTVSDTFTSATTHSVAHTFGTKDVIVSVYDSNDDVFIPARINTPTTSSVVIYMEPATTGRVVIGRAGHIVSGSTLLDNTGVISGSSQIASDISGSLSNTAIAALGVGIISSSAQIDSDLFDIDGLVSSSAQIASDISGSFTSTSSSLASRLSTAESELSNTLISSSGNLVSGELVYSTGGTSVSSSNLVYLDTANERVGIKTTSPQYPFHYVQDTGNALAVYEKTGGAAIFYEAQDTRGALGTVASHPLLFAINSAEVSRINTSGVYEGDLSGSLTGTASYASTAATGSRSVNENTNSGSISFWQGSQSEYDLISASADPNTVYFVV